MDQSTLEMLRASLVPVLTEDSDRALDERLAELGWDEVLADDATAALQLLFETKGTTLSAADALGPLLAGTLASALDAPELAAGVVVLPASLHARPLAAEPGNGPGLATGTALARPSDAAPVIIPIVAEGGRLRLAVVGSAQDWTWARLDGTDETVTLFSTEGKVDTSTASWFDEPDASAAWDAAVAAGRWALGAELVGIGRHVVTQAVSYAGERQQYGRPIGTFQAVQHRLASAHATVVGASHVVAEAAASGSVWTALVAKAIAGRAAEDACTQAQQVYGAIGFTWEHELHRYLRRVYMLDRLLGDWRTLEFEIGTTLQSTGQVPKIGAL
jgi:hypothetical protein